MLPSKPSLLWPARMDLGRKDLGPFTTHALILTSLFLVIPGFPTLAWKQRGPQNLFLSPKAVGGSRVKQEIDMSPVADGRTMGNTVRSVSPPNPLLIACLTGKKVAPPSKAV